MTDQIKINMYLDWCNNFISLEGFASYYDLTLDEAETIINEGRILHNINVC